MINNPDILNPSIYLVSEYIEYEGKVIIKIHIPISFEVHSYI
jgi:ATP-dependent DNA helicase RecG